MFEEIFGKVRFGPAELIFCLEICILTLVYYIFYQTHYRIVISASAGELTDQKYILLALYILLAGFIMFYAKGYLFGIELVRTLINRYLWLILIINLITYLQLCLVSGQWVILYPMLEAALVQFILTIITVLSGDAFIKQFRSKGRMLIIGSNPNIETGETIDGYKVCKIYSGDCGMLKLSELLELSDKYDSVTLNSELETEALIIDHCLRNKKPIYVIKNTPLFYGIRREHKEETDYVLILGKEGWKEDIKDRIRAYLA